MGHSTEPITRHRQVLTLKIKVLIYDSPTQIKKSQNATLSTRLHSRHAETTSIPVKNFPTERLSHHTSLPTAAFILGCWEAATCKVMASRFTRTDHPPPEIYTGTQLMGAADFSLKTVKWHMMANGRTNSTMGRVLTSTLHLNPESTPLTSGISTA